MHNAAWAHTLHLRTANYGSAHSACKCTCKLTASSSALYNSSRRLAKRKLVQIRQAGVRHPGRLAGQLCLRAWAGRHTSPLSPLLGVVRSKPVRSGSVRRHSLDLAAENGFHGFEEFYQCQERAPSIEECQTRRQVRFLAMYL